ncbi:MAG: hypothetical protein M1118_11815 [Chloroflexi bacterium]|nr:hypothetical protein [Chloroflexota bacterium]
MNTPTAGASQSSTTAGATQQADRKLDAFLATVTAVPSGQHKPVSISLSDSELLALLRQVMPSQPRYNLQLSGLSTTPEGVVVEGSGALGGFQVPVQGLADVSADAGALQVTLTQLTAAGVPVPLSTRTSLQSAINRRLQNERSLLPLDVAQVTLGSHVITLSGVTR